MADVRLTAVNPEDSQVYPVACNDKGELLLESTNGDFDVPGNLTVGPGPGATISSEGSAEFAGIVDIGTPDYTSNTGVGVEARSDGLIRLQRVSSSSSAVLQAWRGSLNTATISANGSAEFAGNIIQANWTDDASGGVRITSGADSGSVQIKGAGGSDIALSIRSGGNSSADDVASVKADGSASFAGTDIALDNAGIYLMDGGNAGFGNYRTRLLTDGSAEFSGSFSCAGKVGAPAQIGISNPGNRLKLFGYSTVNANTFTIDAQDGAATFSGNVTAPNINFKLAPEYVTTLPAPLIDEGFVANDQIDLLTELIKMKVQIRDLNAFMERSLQENPET